MAPPDRRVLLHQRLYGRRSHSIFLPGLRIWTVSLADLLYPIRSHGCASDPDKDPVMEKDGRLPPQSNGGRSYRRQKTYQIRSLICESSSPARPAWLVVEPFPFWWPRDTERLRSRARRRSALRLSEWWPLCTWTSSRPIRSAARWPGTM